MRLEFDFDSYKRLRNFFLGFFCKVGLEPKHHRGGLALGEDSVGDRDRIITGSYLMRSLCDIRTRMS